MEPTLLPWLHGGRIDSARRRARDEVEALPSDSFRVRVYAGLDPISHKRHYLTKVVPAGPKAAKEAEKVRTRLLAEVDDRRNPRPSATVNQLLERYLDLLEIEDTTRGRLRAADPSPTPPPPRRRPPPEATQARCLTHRRARCVPLGGGVVEPLDRVDLARVAVDRPPVRIAGDLLAEHPRRVLQRVRRRQRVTGKRVKVSVIRGGYRW